MNRVQKALLSAKKQKVAKYKDQFRQGVGGTSLTGLGIELYVIVKCDAGTEYEFVVGQGYVAVPMHLQADGKELFKFLCQDFSNDIKPEWCENVTFEVVSLDSFTFELTRCSVEQNGFYTEIKDNNLYNSLTCYGDHNDHLFVVTNLFDFKNAEAFNIKQKGYLDYYGFDLNFLHHKLLNNNVHLEDLIVAEVVNTIYDFKNKNNIPDNLLKGFIYWLENNLVKSECEEDLIEDTLGHLHYLNYLHMNGFNTDMQYFYNKLAEHGYPTDIKQIQLYISSDVNWTDKEQDYKYEELYSYHRQQDNLNNYTPIYYPEYDWFDLAVNSRNYPKGLRADTFYPSYVDIEQLKENKIRNFKCSSSMINYNPFVAIKALGLAQHLPTGMLCSENTVELIRKLAHLVKNGDIRVAKGFVCKELDPETITMLLTYSHYLGKEVVNGDIAALKYVFGHSQLFTSNPHTHSLLVTDTVRAIPEKYKAQIAKSRQLLTYIFENQGEVDWTLGNSAKKATILTLAKLNNCSEQVAEQLFNFPSAVEAIRYQTLNPNTHVVDTLPKLTFEHNGLVLEKLPKQDIRNLYMGDLTGCCQKLGGFGEDVCTEGWKDPHSANYVFRTGNTFLAHVWVFETQDGGLMLDSVEGLSQVSVTTVAKLIEEFVSLVNRPVYISYTGYGVTSQVRALLKTSEISENEASINNIKPICNYSYTDFKGKCDLIIA